MARNLTNGMVTHFTSENTRPILLIKGEFDSGNLNLWTGLGELFWNGEVYNGSGEILKISKIEETTELKATGVTFTLSGVEPDLISLALNEPYQGRAASLYIAAVDESGILVPDPFLMFEAEMDVMNISDDVDDPVITLSVENILVSLRRVIKRFWTKEDQALEFPDDQAFDLIPSLQEKEIIFGR